MTEPREKQRDARFIKPPNRLKEKVGNGGIADKILERAQKLVSENKVDFPTVAEPYMEALYSAINHAENNLNGSTKRHNEDLINAVIFPTMQLKANGGMFHYPLITKISDRIVLFLEEIKQLDRDVLDILQAYYKTIRLVLNAQIKSDDNEKTAALYKELDWACERYFQKNSD